MSEGEGKTRGNPNARPTIGYLASSIHDASAVAQWTGVLDAAREYGANVVCFPGFNLRDPRSFQGQANVLYSIVGAGNVDGVVSWASTIGNYVDADEIRAFHEHYRPLPVVIIGRVIEGFPGLLMDSYEGMREAIAHLIEVHGVRRLAFIRGPESHFYAQERYRAYLETLAVHALPLDPQLVTPPSAWGSSAGAAAMRLLLDERGLRPQVEIEAVVAANDGLALGAMEVLQDREIQVPTDVAVVGFNNTVQGGTSASPLTSVAVPFHKVGYRAVETLLKLLAGEPVPDQEAFPSELVVRQSCGCADPAVVQAAVGKVAELDETLESVLATRREEIIANTVQVLDAGTGAPSKTGSERVGRLLDALAADLAADSPGRFLPALDEMLRRMIVTGGDVVAWQNVLSALRRPLLPYFDREVLVRADDLFQQARVMIGGATQRAYARQIFQAEGKTETLRDVEATFDIMFDVRELMDAIAQELPRLGIPSCYLSLYEDPVPYRYPASAPEWSRLILAYDENGGIDLISGGRRFPTRQLVPEGMLPQDRRYSLVVEPLYLRENQLGFVLFEVGPREASVYPALCQGIGSALYGALLLRAREETEASLQMAYTEVEKAYAEVEQQVRERTAELEREVEERERAQAESLRLQQEVIEAQQRAIRELSTPIIPVLEGVIVMPLIGSIDTLRARDVTRSLLRGIREHRARVVILDITGVPIVDSGVAAYLNKTIQAARLRGARTIVTGVSDAVAETVVDLGIDWSDVETLRDLQTGLRAALSGQGGVS
ncbi:MAG: substrate-binding domain-containing protein [Anaerolineae bacterium]|nr:substrate-binding domain-containing protein [Anaerolineae bacterium]